MGKASTKAQNKYISKKYDRINLIVPKGYKELIQAHAEANGGSLTGYINRLISADMDQNGKGTAE